MEMDNHLLSQWIIDYRINFHIENIVVSKKRLSPQHKEY